MKKNMMIVLWMAILTISIAGCKKNEEEKNINDVQENPIIQDSEENPSENEQQNPNINAKVKAPNVVGTVLEVKEGGKLVLVDSKDVTINGQIWIAITDDINFFENITEDVAIGYRDVSRAFEIGNYVEIIVDGPIMESYPMQASASAVAVNEKQ